MTICILLQIMIDIFITISVYDVCNVPVTFERFLDCWLTQIIVSWTRDNNVG